MRGADRLSGRFFSDVDLEDRVPARRPPRLIREIVNDVRDRLSPAFDAAHASIERPSIASEKLLRARFA